MTFYPIVNFSSIVDSAINEPIITPHNTSSKKSAISSGSVVVVIYSFSFEYFILFPLHAFVPVCFYHLIRVISIKLIPTLMKACHRIWLGFGLHVAWRAHIAC